jgi:nitroreductase
MLHPGGPPTPQERSAPGNTRGRMSAIEAIGARSSVRSFQYRELEDAVLLGLLRSAVRAPIALEREPWAFAIVQDRVMLRRISNHAKELWATEARTRNPGAATSAGDRTHGPVVVGVAEINLFHNAGTLVIVGARSNDPYADAECWMAAENLMIAATAFDLGTCVIGAAVSALSDPVIRAEIGVSTSFRPIVPIVIGYPQDRPTPSPRRDPDIVTWRR